MFNRQRTILLTKVRKITQTTPTLLLRGDTNVSLDENICVILSLYMRLLQRFVYRA